MISVEQKYYLKIGRADNLQNKREKLIYRIFEMIPAVLAWLTLFFAIIFSWVRPVWAAIFIIAFDIYWFLRLVYLSVHQISSFKKMSRNLKINWMEKLTNGSWQEGWKNIYHLIVLPMYKESLDILDSTFESLIKSTFPLNKIIVVLAVEERVGDGAKIVSEKIREKYGDKFFQFLITIHPQNIAGEIAGKGSNQTFAIKQAKTLIIDKLGISYDNIIVSSFDIDTRIYPDYFSCLTYYFLANPGRHHSSYQPIPLYNNNIWDAPVFSRVAATSTTFWQMMQQERPEQLITYSSHSMSFKALNEMDFWQTNVISEDSRIFWQALLFYDGNYKVTPLYFPISMDANLAGNFWQTLKNVYRQHRRWGYGSENWPYLIFGFWKNKKIALSIKIRYISVLTEGLWSWATASLLIFFLGWLPIILGGEAFRQSLLSYNLPRLTRIIMTLAMSGMILSGIINLKILPPMPKNHSRWKIFLIPLQWILVPINLIIFGAFPAIDGQTRLMLGRYLGFWVTEKHRKQS